MKKQGVANISRIKGLLKPLYVCLNMVIFDRLKGVIKMDTNGPVLNPVKVLINIL